jgi:uncharacterized protein YqhQ
MAQEFSYGGQAVIEGVMMRGSRALAVAVRAPDGSIVLHEEPVSAALYRGPISKIPFVRGLTMLWDALGLGMRSLMFSANVAVGDEAEFSGPLAWGTIAVSLTLGVGLFFVAPAAAADGLQTLTGLQSALLGNLVEGIIRLIIVVGYIWLIGRIRDVQRLFAYHGAEHKTINAYESGARLEPVAVMAFPKEHARCGTAFLLIVILISILLFAVLGRPPLLIRLASRVVLIPVIAGIAYEYLRFTARYRHNPLVRLLIRPNLALQRLTTREPTAYMLAVAIVALERVLAAERAGMDEPVAETSAVEAA